MLALALSWFAESVALAWAACLFLLVLAASRLLTRVAPRIEATRVVSGCYLHPGEKVRIWVRLRIFGRVLPWAWLQASETLPPLPFRGNRGLLSPAAVRQTEFAYTLQATRRGYFSVGPLTLRQGDPFGFAEKGRTLLEAESITVFPRVVGLGRTRVPLARSAGELHTQRRVFEDSSRPAGIRPYRPSDGRRRIHWRATARTGRLQSKVNDVSASLQALLVLNLHRPDYPPGPAEAFQASELAISLAASLAVYLLSAGQRVGLIANGVDVREREAILQETGADHSPESVARLSDELASKQGVFLPPSRAPQRTLEILSLLARLQPARGRSLVTLLEEARPQLSWGETVVLITSAVDAAAVHSLGALSHAGFSVLPLVVGDSPVAAKARLSLTAARLCPHRILSEEDIGGVFA